MSDVLLLKDRNSKIMTLFKASTPTKNLSYGNGKMRHILALNIVSDDGTMFYRLFYIP